MPVQKRKIKKRPVKREKRIGSRAQVWHGTAKQTAGGLKKQDLKRSRYSGKIVSQRRSNLAKSQYKKNGLAAYRAKPFSK